MKILWKRQLGQIGKLQQNLRETMTRRDHGPLGHRLGSDLLAAITDAILG